jgi:pimeloyl-ACP methyl ester carboxylesterase
VRPTFANTLLAAGFLAAGLFGSGLAAAQQDATLPNLPLPTLGGKQLWSDVRWRSGWRVQRHTWTGHHRLLNDKDVRRAWGGLPACEVALDRLFPTPKDSGSTGGPEHLVILLHGLGRSRESMSKLARSLEAEGHTTANISYASTRGDISSHADDLSQLIEHLDSVDRISFVTHSLGGLVARELLGREAPWMERVSVRRLVMIGPPNRGSALAQALADMKPFQWVAGSSALEVGRADGPPVPEPPNRLPVLVVAGSRGTPGGYNPLIAGDDDGIVGVAETRLERQHEHLVVRGMHTFLMTRPEVLRAVIAFLKPKSEGQSRER